MLRTVYLRSEEPLVKAVLWYVLWQYSDVTHVAAPIVLVAPTFKYALESNLPLAVEHATIFRAVIALIQFVKLCCIGHSLADPLPHGFQYSTVHGGIVIERNLA